MAADLFGLAGDDGRLLRTVRSLAGTHAGGASQPRRRPPACGFLPQASPFWAADRPATRLTGDRLNRVDRGLASIFLILGWRPETAAGFCFQGAAGQPSSALVHDQPWPWRARAGGCWARLGGEALGGEGFSGRGCGAAGLHAEHGGEGQGAGQRCGRAADNQGPAGAGLLGPPVPTTVIISSGMNSSGGGSRPGRVRDESQSLRGDASSALA